MCGCANVSVSVSVSLCIVHLQQTPNALGVLTPCAPKCL